MDRLRLFELLNRINISELMTMLAILINNNEVEICGQKHIKRNNVPGVLFRQGNQAWFLQCMYGTPHW